MPESLSMAELFTWDYQTTAVLLQQIGVASGIFLVFFLLQRFLARKIIGVLARLSKNTATDFDDQLIRAFEKPLQLFLVVLGAYLAFTYLPLSLEQDQTILKLFRSSLIILVIYGFYNLAGNYEVNGTGLAKWFGFTMDPTLVPFIAKIFRFLVVFLGITIVAGEWGFDVNGFLAGLGLGGLALALAAKDTVANLFGGIVIITDKPFSIGDWIQTPSIEGTVEDINFRSTRIRTFAQALITVPNSALANEPITNWSRMGKRRISFKLRVTYGTNKESLERCVTAIRIMLEEHPEIDQQTIFVRFESFYDQGFEIFLYFFTKTTVWGEFLRVKEDVNYKIMEIMEKEGVSVALPRISINLASQSDGEQVVVSDDFP